MKKIPKGLTLFLVEQDTSRNPPLSGEYLAEAVIAAPDKTAALAAAAAMGSLAGGTGYTVVKSRLTVTALGELMFDLWPHQVRYTYNESFILAVTTFYEGD